MSRIRDQLGAVVEVSRHSNWRGRREIAWYAIRRLFVAPASEGRCFMGAPVATFAHCPRPALDVGLWCRVHLPKPERRGSAA